MQRPSRRSPYGEALPGRHPEPVSRRSVDNPAPRGCVFGYAGRTIHIRPLVFWAMGASVLLMAMWSAATASYFVFRDDVLTRLIARQADMQYRYEGRIAKLKAKVDQATARQLLDQEQFDHKLDQLARRQAALEAQAAALSGTADSAAEATPAPEAEARAAAPAPWQSAPKPSPLGSDASVTPGRGAQLVPAIPFWPTKRPDQAAGRSALEAKFAQLDRAYDGIAARQMAAIEGVESRAAAKARRIRAVLSDLGVDLSKAPAGEASGGPYVPVSPPSADTFAGQLQRLDIARAEIDRLQRTLISVPIRKPLTGDMEQTSGFGVRVDPFLRSPAFHTGIDFHASVGEPVHATAAGKVTQAGWSSGYGKMVEIDHGNGVATRYAHLSAILVEEGQTVKPGEIVGRVGTTGRSTGPHLHYETRVGGEPVSPRKFLQAAARIGAL